MDASDGFAFANFCAEIECDLENAGFWGEEVIVSMEGLGDDGRRFSKGSAGGLASFEHPGVDENVAQSGTGNPVDVCGDALTATELCGDDGFSLVFCFDGEESGPGDVGVEEGKIGSPRDHGVEHPAALFFVGHEVHMGARDELHAASAGMDIDDDVA